MDRLSDRFYTGFSGRLFLPAHSNDSFAVPSSAVDSTDDDSTFEINAELLGRTGTSRSVSGDTLTITGENQQEREEKQ